MIIMDNIAKQSILEDIRKELRRENACSYETLHQLLFSIRLKEYCNFLKKISAQDPEFKSCFQNLYREMLYYYYQIQPSKLRRFEILNEYQEKELTVGKMLHKAYDMMNNYEDYTFRGVRHIGMYITDMLLVRPFVMLERMEQI